MSDEVVVECGACAGPVYFYACPTHHWAVASECQRCGVVWGIGPCQDCGWDEHPRPERPA